MTESNNSRIDMTTGAVGPRLLKLALPLVAGNLLQTSYNFADMFWVARVSAEAVAAVSLMFEMTFLFISIGFGINAAALAIISQYIGASNERDAENAAAQAILLALATAIVLAVGGFVTRHQLLTVIGARGEVYTHMVEAVRLRVTPSDPSHPCDWKYSLHFGAVGAARYGSMAS